MFWLCKAMQMKQRDRMKINKKVINMKVKFPILVLRLTTLLCAAAGILMCIFALPLFGTAMADDFPVYAFWQYPILAGLYAAAACFFFALFHFWMLLAGADKSKTLPPKNLKTIRISAAIFAVLYFLSVMPVIYLYAEVGDAPGLIIIAAFLGTLPIGVCAFAAILEKIIKKA
jgi:hypothetical protein